MPRAETMELNAAQHTHVSLRTHSQETTKAPAATRAYANGCDTGRESATASSGEDRTRTPAENAGKTAFPAASGAECGASGGAIDADLETIIDGWFDLPAVVKVGILAMVRAARG